MNPGDNGHDWMNARHLGAGGDEVCANCHVRRSSDQALLPCADVERTFRLPRPPQHEYDPLA